MAELVYAFDLKSNGEIHMGSSPISGTKLALVALLARPPNGHQANKKHPCGCFFISRRETNHARNSTENWAALNFVQYSTFILTQEVCVSILIFEIFGVVIYRAIIGVVVGFSIDFL